MAKTPEIDLRQDYQRNYIINGNFDFWQRGTSLTPISDSQVTRLADRFFVFESGTGSIDYERSTDVPDADFVSLYSAKITVNSTGSHSGLTSTTLGYRMEGHDFAGISGKKFTLSFYVKSSVPGTYCISFRNNDVDRSYVTEYTIDSADTWEKKTIVVQHDDSGTWLYDNNIGMRMLFVLGAGPDGDTTPDSWQSGDFRSTSNQTNLTANAAATWNIAQVQLIEGAEDLPFRRAGRTIGEELMLCQRYYEKSYPVDLVPGTPGISNGRYIWRNAGSSFSSSSRWTERYVYKRAAATITPYAPVAGTINSVEDNTGVRSATSTGYNSGFELRSNDGATSGDTIFAHWTADAEL